MAVTQRSRSHPIAPSSVLHASGAITLAVWAWLSAASHTASSLGIPALFTCLVIVWTALGLAWWKLRSANQQPSWKAIVGWALLFRAVAFFGQPVFEDDYHRYLWDGWRFLQSGDPYDSAPAAHFGATTLPSSLVSTLDGVNHPELPTPYGPTFQIFFAAAAGIAPGSLWSVKLLLLLAEAAFLFAGSRLMAPRNFLLLAWAPLLVHEVGFNAHPDIIGLALLAWALVLCRNFAAHRPNLWPVVAMGALLGLMISARPFAGLLAALVLVALGKHSVRAALLAGVVTTAAALLLHLPFLSSPGAAGLTSLKIMADGRMFNALVAEVVFRNLPVSTGQSLLAAGLLVSASLTTWFWWRRSLDQPPSMVVELLPGAAVMGLFLLWSPAINPWYALWILPFAALRPRVWSWTALIVVSVSYASFRNVAPESLEGYRLLPWVQPLEAIAVAAALVVDAVRFNRARQRGAGL